MVGIYRQGVATEFINDILKRLPAIIRGLHHRDLLYNSAGGKDSKIALKRQELLRRISPLKIEDIERRITKIQKELDPSDDKEDILNRHRRDLNILKRSYGSLVDLIQNMSKIELAKQIEEDIITLESYYETVKNSLTF